MAETTSSDMAPPPPADEPPAEDTARARALDERLLGQELSVAVRALVGRLPAYGRLYWRLLRQGKLGRRQQAVALGALAYTISPVDLVPGIIPVVGQMDDLAVALLGLRVILRAMPAVEAEGHLAAVDLSLAQLDADLSTLGKVALALGRQGVRLAGRIMTQAGRRLTSGFGRGSRPNQRPPAP